MRFPTGEALVKIMIVASTVERSDNGILVHQRGGPRHELGDLDPRNVRANRRKLTTNLNGRGWLHVKHVQLRGATGQENHDDRLVRALNAVRLLCTQQLRQRSSAKSEATNP